MPLIDTSYFTHKDMLIANLSNSNVAATLTDFITEKQPQFLRLLFGSLYADYAAGVLIDPVPAIWSALQNMEGVKKAFACYVYYYWMRADRTKTTAEGEVKPKAENSEIVYNNQKMIDAWNQIWPLVSGFVKSMDGQRNVYTTWPYSYEFFLYQQFRPINDFGI